MEKIIKPEVLENCKYGLELKKLESDNKNNLMKQQNIHFGFGLGSVLTV